MKERLIEHWLDNVNERTYQPAFLQMLSGEGHRLIHSTRHMAIEFGKDVVSIDSNGTPCAFQLKGNPGARLTLNQFREIHAQIVELIEQPIIYPGIPKTPHKCFLVTNGEIEEEVQRAVDDLNRGYERRGFHPNSRLQFMSRGALLDLANRHSGTFWTEGVSVNRKLIKFYNEDGRSSMKFALLSEGLDEILRISDPQGVKSKAEVERRQISASIFTALATMNYSEEKNYAAIAGAHAALFAFVSAAEHRYKIRRSKKSKLAKSLSRDAFFSAAIDLASELGREAKRLEEARSDKDSIDYNALFISGGVFSSYFLWKTRAIKTLAILSILNMEKYVFNQDIPLPDTAIKAIKLFQKPDISRTNIWGEGAIPQILAHSWSWRATDATLDPYFWEFSILNGLVKSVTSENHGYIATPYHTSEEAIRDSIGDSLEIDKGNVQKETLARSSYFAEPLFHCFVRANLKSYAKLVWPELTKIAHHGFIPGKPWEYCMWRCNRGESYTKILKRRQLWLDIQKEASDVSTPNIPAGLREDPVMLLAFIVFFPHRGIPEVVRYLHYEICGTWFLPFPKP